MSTRLALKKRSKLIASTIEPAGKASFVYSCMQTRLLAKYSDKWPISLVCVSKPLMTATTATLLLLLFKVASELGILCNREVPSHYMCNFTLLATKCN